MIAVDPLLVRLIRLPAVPLSNVRVIDGYEGRPR